MGSKAFGSGSDGARFLCVSEQIVTHNGEDAMKKARRKPTKKSRMQKSEKALIDPFDYSQLSPSFSKLAKPAQRGLLNNGIRTPADLALRTVEEVTELHGIGPLAMPILREALRKNGLSFKSPPTGAAGDT
jgi:hypothetical protein